MQTSFSVSPTQVSPSSLEKILVGSQSYSRVYCWPTCDFDLKLGASRTPISIIYPPPPKKKYANIKTICTRTVTTVSYVTLRNEKPEGLIGGN